MKRNLEAFSNCTYDVLIVGGGIYGACVAWDAALRGLSVALVEQGDFGHATSANSQKIVHGGLRYLQHADFMRMRESIRERRTLLQIAPHLVHPLPFLVATRGHGPRSHTAMSAALTCNDLVSWDRNRGLFDSARRIPRSRILSSRECRRWLPSFPEEGTTGGALWFDGQIEHSERLTLAFVHSAVAAGATVVNYLRVQRLVMNGRRVAGAQVEDQLTGRTFDVRARAILNTRGPWMSQFLSSLNGHQPDRSFRFLKAVNLVTRPLYSEHVALGIDHCDSQSRTPGLLFVTPWQGRSIIGTAYTPYAGDPEVCAVSEEEIYELMDEVNAAFPAARLRRADVQFVHMGLLPAASANSSVLETAYRLIDHERADGIAGLVSAVGVKYTTARDVAEKSVDLLCAKLGLPNAGGKSRTTSLWGGEIPDIGAFFAEAARVSRQEVNGPAIRHLVTSYGTRYADVLRLIRENLAWREPVSEEAPTIKAEVIYAVRYEMALTLGDVVFRRTELGAAGHPGAAALHACGELMAAELGWDAARMSRELQQVELVFHRHGVGPSTADAPREQPSGKRWDAADTSAAR